MLGACHPPRRVGGATAGTKDTTWVRKSDAHSKVLLDVVARFLPERAAFLGVEGVDDQILDLRPGFVERYLQAMEEAVRTLRGRFAAERDERVRRDLQILLRSAEMDLASTRIEEAKLLAVPNLAKTIFYSTRALLNEQIAPARRASAATRLRRYAGLEPGYKPLTELATEYVRGRLAVQGLLPPMRERIERVLSTADAMVAGIGELCKRFAIAGCAQAHAALKPELDVYHRFLRTEVLPRARTEPRLPPEVYAQRLRRIGIDLPPAELAALAHKAFAALQAEMTALAAKVSPGATDYRQVIRALKRKQLVGAAILPHYQKRLAELEAIIRRENLVTLPARPARIRLASEAESAGLPAPNMRPPRLLGNRGEQGTFVLPLRVPPPPGADARKQLALDDFTFDAAAWTLTAHEARPGHEMQFAAIVENGVSIARAVFAFNSTNVEGWGLYAERIVFPFMPPEGQLISLQHRLLRSARAFLDPELQSGAMTPAEAYRILREDVVLSEGMARQEVQRYTFAAPGQAPSYFYGYTRIRALREEIQKQLGPRFVARAFHDHLLSLGLLPPDLQREAMLEWAKAQR
jgi:uncharacterized protein (DUF885 family)